MLAIALHEAAHAVAAQTFNCKVAYIEAGKRFGVAQVYTTKLNRIQKAAIYLAGYVAERQLMNLDVSLIDEVYEADLRLLASLKLNQREFLKAMNVAKYIVDIYKNQIYTIMARILEEPSYPSWEGTFRTLEFKKGISNWK